MAFSLRPVLVIAGGHDVVPLEHTRQMVHLLPNCTLRVIRDNRRDDFKTETRWQWPVTPNPTGPYGDVSSP